MYDAASNHCWRKNSQVEGVGPSHCGGGALPAVHVSLDPVRLAANGVSLEQVRSAISQLTPTAPLGGGRR